ncbi:hypothetical protein DOV67_25040 [Salmonella enterica subsp. enterica serovar Java]|uniref:Uncharacterized protein n=3 Tax=Salmonella enterica TaxID=28901 RepID=A0A3Y9C6P6_SALEB|nr:hypothetical protein [Salmonella enterica subsp. enterica serovar Java]EAO1478094.1 hypothetical protein [Salmonella enterica]HBM0100008.1 hypothetical protein [Salmonella enterica subsp. enterica serovar Wedding]EAB8479637.1 hypothetical protein [Salmonella enterica subsp. enterica serovar Java]EBR8574759.1 hypothetical protein [Salmonella enterica subsp. enterica serovar Java]
MKRSAGYSISENTPVPALTYGTCASTGRQKMNVCGDWYRKEYTVSPRCRCTEGQTDRDWRSGALQMRWF